MAVPARYLLVLLMFFICLSPLSAQVARLDGAYLALAGEHRFSTGDNLAWADPDFNDGAWQQVAVPGNWSDYRVPNTTQTGWYRIRFSVPERFKTSRPAFVSYLLQQDEVFLNGRKIGGFGTFAVPGLQPRPDVPTGRLRIYPIDESLLDRKGTNVLAIRLNRRMIFEEGGIAPYVFGLADGDRALAARAPAEKVHWAVEGMLLGMNALLACLAITLVLLGFHNRIIVSFAILISALTLSYGLESHALFDFGYFSPVFAEIRIRLTLLVMILDLEFVAAILAVRPGWSGRSIQGLIAVIALPWLWLPSAAAAAFLPVVMWGLLAAIIASALWISAASLLAILKGRQVGWFMLVIHSFSISLPVIWNAAAPEQLAGFSYLIGRWPHTLTTQMFMLGLAAMAGYRIFRIEQERLIANDRALRAQSDERSRVARDMHDSVGQWLGTIKMRLQMMGAEVSGNSAPSQERLAELVGDMDVLIDDTRRIARDLSPSAIAHKGLGGALRAHMNTLTEDHDIKAQIDIDEELPLDEGFADHIYRIVQEVSNNAVIHGAARTVSIRLEAMREPGLKHGILLSIEDDGTGFDTEKSRDRHSLGLTSITERAAMMGGEAVITSGVGAGTRVAVKI